MNELGGKKNTEKTGRGRKKEGEGRVPIEEQRVNYFEQGPPSPSNPMKSFEGDYRETCGETTTQGKREKY